MANPYKGKLPERFAWKDCGSGDGTTLVFGARVIGRVLPQGSGWVAQIEKPFLGLGGTGCVVASQDRGQAWLGQWLRRRDHTVREMVTGKANC